MTAKKKRELKKFFLLFLIILILLTDGSQNRNGEIIDETPLKVAPEFQDEVECSKIVYLSDGLQVKGFIVKPKKQKSEYPVLIYCRGGNREFGKIDESQLYYLWYLASSGYVVIASQYRGADGSEGKDEFGGKDINDVLNLFLLIEQLRYTNPDKVVMLGYSRGGMMTYLAIKNNAPMKAAAVVGAPTDLIQSYKKREPEFKQVLNELIGGDPETKEKEYKERSSYYWPEKINTPVLILHGEADWRVNVDQAEKLAEKLEELGKEYKLVTYPVGDHVLDFYRQERNQEISSWFGKYLQPEESVYQPLTADVTLFVIVTVVIAAILVTVVFFGHRKVTE